MRSRVCPGGAGDSDGDVQQPVAQLLGFGGGQSAVEEEQLGPGEQVDAGEGQFEPGGVDREDAGREPSEAAVFASADAVLDAGVGAVPGFQELNRAAAGVGAGRGVSCHDLVAHAHDGVE